MCRWNAYFGKPVVIDELLYETKHSLIDQSLHSSMGAETTNGDGFGLGWYDPQRRTDPGRYRSINPAWNDANLRDLTRHISTHIFLAHVRATSGSPIQNTNCHPFQHGNWLFVHNGLIDGFAKIRRELMFEIEPSLYNGVAGTTDSETIFYLALSYGLEHDPLPALERAIGKVEAVGRAAGIDQPMQGTIGCSDGETLYAVRYSSAHQSRTLFVSQDLDTLRQLHPGNPRLGELDETSRMVVSEPISDLPGDWIEVPESTALIVTADGVEQRDFTPVA